MKFKELATLLENLVLLRDGIKSEKYILAQGKHRLFMCGDHMDIICADKGINCNNCLLRAGTVSPDILDTVQKLKALALLEN